MMKMIGSQTMGETGLNSEMSGVIAAMKILLNPQRMPRGMAIKEATRKPTNTQRTDRSICAGRVPGLGVGRGRERCQRFLLSLNGVGRLQGDRRVCGSGEFVFQIGQYGFGFRDIETVVFASC